ncbi:MAG: META domain-containing protein [Bacteroidales bacterium]
MKKILILNFIMVLVGFGCEKESLKDSGLLKTKWILSSIQDTKTNAVTNYPSDASRKISIVFTDSLNVLSFSGICNGGAGTYSYVPSYTFSYGAIKITDLVTTLIYCSDWEGYTIQNLDAAFSYRINGNNLVIYSTGAYNLYFTKN